MKKIVLLIPFLLIFVFSCKQKENITETITARQYYDSISYYYGLSRPVQQELINQTTQALMTIKADKNAVIDTKPLEVLLDSAIRTNYLRITDIQRIKEVDSEISYKEKTLTYLKFFDEFYRNELSQFIELLHHTNEDRGSKGSALLLPKLQLIKAKQTEWENAKNEFKEKYPAEKDGNYKVAPDYEFVRLSEFNYEKAGLEDGEEVSMVSFSGDYDCDDKNIYYHQLLVITKKTRDTIRVLCPCQPFDYDNLSRIGYFQNIPLNEKTKNDMVPNSFIIFNKHLADLEKKNYKTTTGTIVFIPETNTK